MSEPQSPNRRIFLHSAAQLAAGRAAAHLCVSTADATPPKRKANSGPTARYDSYCGIFCGSCSACFSTEYGIPSKVQCLGCKSGNTAPHCTNCKIKDCAKGKELDNCSACKEYPCQQLKDFHNNGAAYRYLASHNLDEIKNVGVDKWLDQQKKRWVCKNCNTRFTIRDKVCLKCRRPVYSADQEAADLKAKATG